MSERLKRYPLEKKLLVFLTMSGFISILLLAYDFFLLDSINTTAIFLSVMLGVLCLVLVGAVNVTKYHRKNFESIKDPVSEERFQ